MATNMTDVVTITTVATHTSTVVYADTQVSLGAVDIFVVVLMSILIIIAFQGNLWIIIAIFSTPQLRSTLANIFIVNLCIADLLASILAMPLSVASYVNGRDALNKETCEVSGFFTSFVMVSSMLSLCVISVERFYSISLPMHHASHATPCAYLTVIICVWSTSLVLSLLPVFGINSYSFRPVRRACSFDSRGSTSSGQSFVIVLFVISFLIPSLTMIAMYVGIFRVARTAATTVGPHPCAAAVSATDSNVNNHEHQIPWRECQKQPVFIVTVPATPKRPLAEIQGVVSPDGSGFSKTRDPGDCQLSREDSGIRTAEMTDSGSLHSLPLNVCTVEKDIKDRSSSRSREKPWLCDPVNPNKFRSKFLCVCRKVGFCSETNSKSCILNTALDSRVECSPNQQETITHGSENVHKSLPKSHDVSLGAGKVKPNHLKAFRTLMFIVISYLVLWSPYFVCQLYELGHHEDVSESIELLVTWLSFLSYAVNPCLYGLMNRSIREELAHLLKSCGRLFCCGFSNGRVTCRRPCQKDLKDDHEDMGEDDLDGAENFYQFLQRTQASGASSPVTAGNAREPPDQTDDVSFVQQNAGNVQAGAEKSTLNG